MHADSPQQPAPTSNDYPFMRTPVKALPGVGPQKANLLHRLEIYNVATLMKHLPLRWERHAGQVLIRDLSADQKATVIVEIAHCRWVPGQRGYGAAAKGRFEAMLEDASGEIQAIWFNSGYLRDKLHPGMKLQLEGKISHYQQQVQMVNPHWRILDDEATGSGAEERLVPIYPSTEGLPVSFIQRLIENALPQALAEMDDHFQSDFLESKSLPSLSSAYRMIHQPEDEDEIRSARRRLAYDEVYLLQLAVLLKRYHHQHHHHAPQIELDESQKTSLYDIPPFTLTGAQQRVIEEVLHDMTKPYPMNRLIQGDVGSGKTMVALLSMIAVIHSGYQAALMAPTELLAEQHYRSILKALTDLDLNIALLHGSVPEAEARVIREDIESGKLDLVIGTHALLSESVQFDKLGLCVIDEQHRFGVQQRAQLKQQGEQHPHCLVMTATPIPRSLSLTVFGDLDLSMIDELPPGRQSISTRFIHEDDALLYYQELRGKLESGQRAYLVLPTIEEGTQGLRSVTALKSLLSEGPLEGLPIAAIHGRMPGAERDQIMDQFREGSIQLLIATTVIEVGVDVPEATIMIIDHAERFGLAQLHQLRGRVGRGVLASECILLGNPTTEHAEERLQTMVRTQDGFEIAEVDLAIRGMGDTSGTRQSGADVFRIARLPDDLSLLQMARRDAAALIETDPVLSESHHDLLRRRLLKEYGKKLNFIDVG